MLILGNMLWRSTGVGATPTPPTPPPVVTTEQPKGTAEWLWQRGDGRRSAEDVRKARERFGIRDEVADAIAAVAARQAEAQAAASAAAQAEADEQKRFDELFRELELRSIKYEARYTEILGALREQFLRQRQEEEEIMLLMLIAASAVA